MVAVPAEALAPPPAWADAERWLIVCSLAAAVGLMLLAYTYTAARAGLVSDSNLFWASMLLLFVPAAWGLARDEAPRMFRLQLLLIVSMCLYVAKIVHSPQGFTFHDELLHVRTLNDILASGRLFQENPVLPVSPLFPGLEVVTAAIVQTTGLSVYVAGVLVIGMARIIAVLALFQLFRLVTSLDKFAGLATLYVICNQHFLFFDAMFSYQSLALPQGIVLIYFLCRQIIENDLRPPALLVIFILLSGVTLTHHLTSYLLAAFILFWALYPQLYQLINMTLDWYAGQLSGRQIAIAIRNKSLFSSSLGRFSHVDHRLYIFAFVSLLLPTFWLVLIAEKTVGYLSPIFAGALSDLAALLAGDAPVRQLFQDHSGEKIVLWEQLATLISVLITLALLVAGATITWQRQRVQPLVFVLVTISLAYPVLLGLRMTPLGADISGRSNSFLAIAIAVSFTTGALATQAWLRARTPYFVGQALLVAILTLIFVGGIVAGAGPRWVRFPGPYLVAAEARSIEAAGIASAVWTRAELGSQQRIAADRINRLLLAAYGGQHPVTSVNEGVDISPLFVETQFTEEVRRIIVDSHIDFLLVDLRLSEDLPRVGIYFEEGEQGGRPYTEPIPRTALVKYDSVQGVSRVFDSGVIVIYDLRGLRDAIHPLPGIHNCERLYSPDSCGRLPAVRATSPATNLRPAARMLSSRTFIGVSFLSARGPYNRRKVSP